MNKEILINLLSRVKLPRDKEALNLSPYADNVSSTRTKSRPGPGDSGDLELEKGTYRVSSGTLLFSTQLS